MSNTATTAGGCDAVEYCLYSVELACPFCFVKSVTYISISPHVCLNCLYIRLYKRIYKRVQLDTFVRLCTEL